MSLRELRLDVVQTGQGEDVDEVEELTQQSTELEFRLLGIIFCIFPLVVLTENDFKLHFHFSFS